MTPHLVIAIGDLHTASVTGICPPKVQLDSGGYYYANQFQLYLHEMWLDMWKQLRKKAKILHAPVTTVVLGDTLDKNVHSKNGVFAHNPNSMLRAAVKLLKPARKLSDRIYVLRGTPAHEGEEAWLAEALGERIGAEKAASHAWSWWHLPLNASGVTFDIKHHPESGDMRWWTAGGGMIRSATSVELDYVETLKARVKKHGIESIRLDDIPPDIVLRGHRHQWRDSGTNLPTRAFTIPAWQGPTDFVHRIGAGGSKIPKFGCAWFYCENGDYEWGRIMYQPDRPKAEVI